MNINKKFYPNGRVEEWECILPDGQKTIQTFFDNKPNSMESEKAFNSKGVLVLDAQYLGNGHIVYRRIFSNDGTLLCVSTEKEMTLTKEGKALGYSL